MAMSSIEFKTVAPFAKLGDFAIAMFDRYNAWAETEKVRSELMAYTDRELADLGLSRHQIRHLDLTTPRKSF